MQEFPIPRLEEVPGFLTAEAALLLDRLGRWQSAEGIGGDIAEIGVFYGRSALVLGRTLGPGESLIACDRFDVDAAGVPGWSWDEPLGPEPALRRRWAEWVGDDGLVVRVGDSTKLGPGDLGAPARLIHVDGGHEYDVALADMRLATRALAPEGALVVDDVLLPEWPDVTVALIDHLRAERGALTVVAVAQHKAVVCRPRAVDRYRAWAAAALPAVCPPPGFLVTLRGLDGDEVLVASRLTG